MVSCEFLDLSCLLIEDVASVAEVLIDELLVLDVDERAEVHERDAHEREAPERKPFDQPVRHERGDECLACVERSACATPRKRKPR